MIMHGSTTVPFDLHRRSMQASPNPGSPRANERSRRGFCQRTEVGHTASSQFRSLMLAVNSAVSGGACRVAHRGKPYLLPLHGRADRADRSNGTLPVGRRVMGRGTRGAVLPMHAFATASGATRTD